MRSPSCIFPIFRNFLACLLTFTLLCAFGMTFVRTKMSGFFLDINFFKSSILLSNWSTIEYMDFKPEVETLLEGWRLINFTSATIFKVWVQFRCRYIVISSQLHLEHMLHFIKSISFTVQSSYLQVRSSFVFRFFFSFVVCLKRNIHSPHWIHLSPVYTRTFLARLFRPYFYFIIRRLCFIFYLLRRVVYL